MTPADEPPLAVVVPEWWRGPSPEDMRRFMLEHRFGMEEVVTKLSILREEFAHLHTDNPIEHVSSRLKSIPSLVEKMQRKGIAAESGPSMTQIRERVTDIAGVRVVCSFVSDVYHVFDLLTAQSDVTVREVRDYITAPKGNGYRSLHALVEVPVFLSAGQVPVLVEVQLRTIAMDFWASLEHKIYYKYRREVPGDLLDGLRQAADTAASLDTTMEGLHQEIRGLEPLPAEVVARLQGGQGGDEALRDALKHLAD
ncbi:GTP pyrophosphokinase [Nocardioides bruguierae]|uniref:GTP pyrophosphokinase family protein n=1 Tax=Nocardioides bruguierae TaxID=2945102 RepID=A0A9X2IF12_9ACTN|nr:GTP pyrophosphokinase family protein [Nocardioides bruguierae]MCM0620633.1 GTP pyrophosphokinase family protein [Nocardioides bruguierae]